MPRETFTYSATTTAGRERVWAALQEPATWEGVSGVDHVHNPVINSDGALTGFTFESVVAGKTYMGNALPAGREEGRAMAWHIDTEDVAGIVSVSLADANDGTTVSVALAVESTGTLSSIFFPLITSTIGNGFPESVESFARGLD